MAIPWLIGGAVALIAAALASDNDSSSSSSSDDRAREARRREAAERERAESERKKKLEIARENFAMRGENIGSDIAQSLQGWIKVKFEQSPAFSAKLNSKGYKIEQVIQNEQSISALLPNNDHQFDEIRENLRIYSEFYNVKLKKSAKLIESGKEIEKIESELKQVSKLKAEISRLKSYLSTQV
jgi:uncharacterized tellurite resistance protein B-like protein